MIVWSAAIECVLRLEYADDCIRPLACSTRKDCEFLTVVMLYSSDADVAFSLASLRLGSPVEHDSSIGVHGHLSGMLASC